MAEREAICRERGCPVRIERKAGMTCPLLSHLSSFCGCLPFYPLGEERCRCYQNVTANRLEFRIINFPVGVYSQGNANKSSAGEGSGFAGAIWLFNGSDILRVEKML